MNRAAEPTSLIAYGVDGASLWMAYQVVRDGTVIWLGTDRKNLLVQHFDMRGIVDFFLKESDTYSICTNTGNTVMLESVREQTFIDLVTKRLES